MSCWRGPEKTGTCTRCGETEIHMDYIDDNGVCAFCILQDVPDIVQGLIARAVEDNFFRLLGPIKDFGVFKAWDFNEKKELIHELHCRIGHITHNIKEYTT